MSVKKVKNILQRVNLSLRGNSLQYIKRLKEWQWLNNEQALSLQNERIKQILIHSYNNVPYYRKILANADVIDGDGRVNLDNFKHIPLLDKTIIRNNFEELKSTDLHNRRWFYNTSGGSTGEPVRFIQDKEKSEWGRAVKILDDLWSGYSIGERQIRLWGSERDLLVGRETIRTHVGRWLRNEIWLNAYRMTPEQMRGYVKRINEFRPVQILAYVESIYELARLIEREGLEVYSPKAIMTSAGTLYPHMRETIERVFQAPVFNRYGSREVGDIACECEQHQGLHVCMPTHYVEILRPDGTPAEPDEVGEIVVTLLTNYAMPLIRYRIGDMGVWARNKCSCGRCWPLLEKIVGRTTDTFLKKDGTQVHGAYFTLLFFFREWIEKFQVIQEDYDLIRVLIVSSKKISNPSITYSKEIKEITDKIQLVMGQDCIVEFKFVDDILPSSSGKYRYNISKLYEYENRGDANSYEG